MADRAAPDQSMLLETHGIDHVNLAG